MSGNKEWKKILFLSGKEAVESGVSPPGVDTVQAHVASVHDNSGWRQSNEVCA
jgi:hypothetical protein